MRAILSLHECTKRKEFMDYVQNQTLKNSTLSDKNKLKWLMSNEK